MTFLLRAKNVYRKAVGGRLSNTHIAAVTIAVSFAFLFALWPLYSQFNFYYDQARDSYEAYSIWHNFDIKIIGPATDIPGLYHGAGWYYFLALIYLFGQGSPDIAATIFFVISWLTLPIIWLLAKELSKDVKIASLCVVLYVFSPLFQLSTRWISNPTLGLMVMPIILYSMWMYLKKASHKYAVMLGISTAIMIHANLGYALILITAPLFWLIAQKRSWKSLVSLVVSFSAVMSTFLLAEIKFKGRGLQAFLQFLSERKSGSFSLFGILEQVLKKWNELCTFSFVALPIIVTTLLLITALALFFVSKFKKSRRELAFLWIWLLNLVAFQFFNTGISTSVFVHFPYLLAGILLCSVVLGTFVKNKYLLATIAIVIVCFQVQKSVALISESRNPLTVQIGATYANVKKVIDYTYKNSDSSTFTVNTITSPLFINTTWAYAYNFYGQKTYHSLPFWDGRDQSGLLGSLPVRDGNRHVPGETRYLIIEPTTGIPDFFLKQVLGEEDSWSSIVTETKIGNFTIQKRKYKEVVNAR